MKIRENGFETYERALLLLCNEDYEKYYEEIRLLLTDGEFDWNLFLGIMINNRVVGTVYNHLRKDLKIPVVVRRNMEYIYIAQVERNRFLKEVLKRISEVLEQENVNYSFLKGSILNFFYYSGGERVSNDTDILVDSCDLDKVISIYEKMGYIQGRVEGGTIVAATRKEKMFKKLNTYEIVPFIQKTENIYMPFHEVDINYRLSNDDDGNNSNLMLQDNCLYMSGEMKIRGLSIERNLIYLCIHLYREAVMVFKIVRGDDLLLYKFLDIHKIIHNNKNLINWDELYNIAKLMNRITDVHYAFYYTNILFPETVDSDVMLRFGLGNEEYLNQYHGRDNTAEVYEWNIPFYKRMFNPILRIRESKQYIEKENARFNDFGEKIRNEV